jgi:molecular chaperone Hsp33
MLKSKSMSKIPLHPSNRWVKCLSSHGNIRGVAIQATQLISEMARIHGIRGTPAVCLGEAVLGALLVASNSKGSERVNLNIQATGPVRQALVDAHPDGTARGYVITSETAPEIVRGTWGEGLMSVLRTKTENHHQPYIGTVPLITGHLAKDLSFYWVQSEQIPSAVGISVQVDSDGKVETASGFLVQAMPGATAQEIRLIENQINHLQTLAGEFAGGSEPTQLLARIFSDSSFMLLEERQLGFACSCSRERVSRALTLVGATELESMLNEDGRASVRCDFCNESYDFEREQLIELIKSSHQR